MILPKNASENNRIYSVTYAIVKGSGNPRALTLRVSVEELICELFPSRTDMFTSSCQARVLSTTGNAFLQLVSGHQHQATEFLDVQDSMAGSISCVVVKCKIFLILRAFCNFVPLERVFNT